MLTYIQHLVQLTLSPSAGWEDVAAAKPDGKRIAEHCLVPLMGVCALMQWVQFVYHPELSLSTTVLNTIVAFVSMFATYFVARTAFTYRLPALCSAKATNTSERITTVLVFALGLLSLAIGLPSLLPASMGLNYILPVAVGFVVWKAGEYLQVRPDAEPQFLVLIFGSISLPPLLIQALFVWAITN